MLHADDYVFDDAQFAISDRLTAKPGVHAIIGPNNAGKTRLLLQLVSAQFSKKVSLRELDAISTGILKAVRDVYQEQGMAWDNPDADLRWDRTAKYVKAVPRGMNLTKALGNVGYDVSGFGPELVGRAARLVATNRYFIASSNIASKADINNLSTVPAFLEGLKASLTAEAQYVEIQTTFREITEGLEFDIRHAGENLERTVYIREGPGTQFRSLAECGDGLRDLLMIVASAVLYPKDDLLLDEPGLRLHAQTQRRLLSFLADNAKVNDKVVYLTTHDEALITSPRIDGRYFVRRTGQKSVVRGIPSGREIWDSLRELGAEPSRLLGNSGIIVVEGASDVPVVAAVLDIVKETLPEAGGFAVEHLGGDGNIVSANRKVFEVLRRAMPFGDIAVVLDKTGSAPRGEREQFSLYCFENRIKLRELQLGDLEDYYSHELVVRYVEFVTGGTIEDGLRDALVGRSGIARFKEAASVLRNERIKNKVHISRFIADLDRTTLAAEMPGLVGEIRQLVQEARALADASTPT